MGELVTLTNFLSLAFLKSHLQIKTNIHDESFLNICFESSIEADKIILPFANKTPVPDGSVDYERGKTLALSYAKSEWYRQQNQEKLATQYQEKFERLTESLIAVFNAELNTRTRRVAISTDSATRLLFSQVKRY